jgi:tetratricopeptide (TPR) repeat protein
LLLKIPKKLFPESQGANVMKKILVTVVLGIAVAAVGANTAQPAQGQSATPAAGQAAAPAGGQSAAPVIKDPAEYNAYVAAIQQKDPAAKVSGLEAFLTQYPSSVMKNQGLEILMQTYQQTGNVNKATETATKLVAVDPCQVPALTLLTYIDRMKAQGGDPNGKQLSADAGKYGQQGLDCLPKFNKPEGTSDADFQKMKAQMTGNFEAGIGWGALQDKDYAKSAQHLKAASDANPPDSQKDLALLYPLALSYLQQTPPDYQNGIWYAARAAAVAPDANKPAIEKYARSQYVKFHAGDDGWQDVLNAAKAGGPQVPIKPAPTPAEQAHKMVQDTTPDKMDFATWEFVLTNGSQEDQDAVWNAIKGKAVQMVGTVISTTPDTFMVAGSSDDIDAKKADITLKFEDKLPAKMIPKDGSDNFQFQGEPASYTPNPFMMVMEKGRLLSAPKPATSPAHKAPVRRKPAGQ